MEKVWFVLIWLVCAFHNYGYTLGYFTHEYPAQSHRGIAPVMALSGPFGVPAVYFGSLDKHWLLRPLTTVQRWEAFHRLYPSLTREYFDREHD